MKLEIARLRLNLSAAERDRALLSVGTDPATINPNLLLDDSYMVRLCKVANALALLGHNSLEDKVCAAVGLEISDDSAIDFWNISDIQESCSGGMCQVRAEAGTPAHVTSTLPSSTASQTIFLCSECERKVCKVCCAGRGAHLLATYSSKGGSTHNGVSSHGGSLGSGADLSSNNSLSLDGAVCKLCCHEIVLDALILDYTRGLVSKRRSARADRASHEALNHVIGYCSSPSKKKQLSDSWHTKALRQLLNEEESLAEFPYASFLNSVCDLYPDYCKW